MAWLVLAIGLLVQPQIAEAAPALVGGTALPECQIALQMAKSAFASTSPTLYWPIPTLNPAEATIALSPVALDISGGDGVKADPAIFERIQPKALRKGTVFYWQSVPQEGRRIVVAEEPFNWAGDWYYFFTIDEAASKAEFVVKFWDWLHLSDAESGSENLELLFGTNRWRPLTIIRNSNTSALWVLDLGRYSNFAPWRVYGWDANGPVEQCKIEFVPDENIEFALGEPAGLDVLPDAVRRFARLADEALGPRQPRDWRGIADIRNAVQREWENIAQRPWALTGTPYNSKDEIEAGLVAWAEGVPSRIRLYAKLKKSYRPAKEQLSVYMMNRFGIDEAAADEFGDFAIDHMLRSYFLFHSDHPQIAPELSPWPDNVR